MFYHKYIIFKIMPYNIWADLRYYLFEELTVDPFFFRLPGDL